LTILDQAMTLASSIPSQEPQSFYKLLIRGIAAEPGMGDRHYTLLFNEHRKRKGGQLLPLPAPEPLPVIGDMDDGILVDEPPSPERHLPRRDRPRGRGGRAAARGRGGRGGRGAVVDVPPLPPDLPPAPGTPPLPPPPSPEPAGPDPGEHSGDEGILVDDDAVVPGPPRRPPRFDRLKFYPGIGDGVEVNWDSYTFPGDAHPSVRWAIRCPVHGKKCVKTRRVVPNHVASFGAIEPLAYLHAWLSMPVPDKPRATHPRENPTPDMVAAFVAENRDELEAILACVP
jgi:hypothetical protein